MSMATKMASAEAGISSEWFMSGVGEAKMKAYGERFLAEIASFEKNERR